MLIMSLLNVLQLFFYGFPSVKLWITSHSAVRGNLSNYLLSIHVNPGLQSSFQLQNSGERNRQC